MTAAAVAELPAEQSHAATQATIVVLVGILATTLAQPAVLAHLPLQNLLKNELHVSRSANAAFFFLAGLPWYFKPFAGILTDAFPIFGSRRKTYLIVSAVLAALVWLGLYLTPHRYNPLLWSCIACSAFMMTASTVVGAVLVETAQAMAGSGRLTALRFMMQGACNIVAGPGGGYLASIAFGWTCAACGGVMFLLVPVTLIFLYEQRRQVDARQVLSDAGTQLARVATARTMWAVAALTALLYMGPGLTTALFYKQQNELHMNTQGQGLLALIAGLAAVAATIAYGYVCRRLRLRALLVICLLATAVGVCTVHFYNSVTNARIIAAVAGFGAALTNVAMVDLAVRATPRGSEGMGYALLLSVSNVVRLGSDWMGSTLLDRFHLSIDWLILGNLVTIGLTIGLAFLLPAHLVRFRDGEQAPAPAS
jgi:MFS family permease